RRELHFLDGGCRDGPNRGNASSLRAGRSEQGFGRACRKKGGNGMRRAQKGALGGLTAALGLAAVLAAPAQAPRGEAELPLEKRLAKGAKMKEEDVRKLLKAFGPAVRDSLRSGQRVDVPGLGTFQVVQAARHRDLVGGRVVDIPATNYLEFVPTG